MRSLHRSFKWFRSGCGLIIGGTLMTACSLISNIPVVSDERLDSLVLSDARQILAAADPRADVAYYRFRLSAFPRSDLLGLSTGSGRIYISLKLAQLASQSAYHRWMLRQTLAHEIAHELAGHAHQHGALANTASAANGFSAHDLGVIAPVRFQNYSVEKELQADLFGLRYWGELGWNCTIWVDILRQFEKSNYTGDIYHPTDRRLEQASKTCAALRSTSAMRY